MSEQNRSIRKPVEYYLNLSYEIEVQKEEEGGFVVSIPVLPGCITQVEEWGEAEDAIEEVRRIWIQTAYEDGVKIPLPKSAKEYSGKFVLRIPRSMHRNLDTRAQEEGVSLNMLVVSLISQSLGRRDECRETATIGGESHGSDLCGIWGQKLEVRKPKQPETLKLPDRSAWDRMRN